MVTWPDGHVSPYPLSWLQDRSMDPEKVAERKMTHFGKSDPIFWGGGSGEDIRRYDYSKLLSDEKEQLNWLKGR